jgi:hypothetical protein
MAQEDHWKKPGMTRWYDFSVLAMTAPRNALSRALGSMIDTRLLPTREIQDADRVFSYEDRTGEFWFDYVADTGDGWDGTYTMAYLLSSDHVLPNGKSPLVRGEFLVIGGDEVYPYASRTQYAQRLVWPFNQAALSLGKLEDPRAFRDLYCIPGNHDWYDSLASFTRRFCNKRTIGCFRTRQGCSYFVLKLPHLWQLWAVDLQLHQDIDVQQLEFFRRHARTLTGKERVILCHAEPDWVLGERTEEDLLYNAERIERLVEASGAQVHVHFTGDLHHYQRYESQRTPGPGVPNPRPYTQVKLVSGGGGAFLHPTHTSPSATKSGEHLKSLYPSRRVSKRLSTKLLLFAPLNWQLSLLFGVVYLMAYWSVSASPTWTALPIEYPGSSLLLLVLGVFLVGFADVSRRWSAGVKILVRLLLGSVHFAGHAIVGWQAWRIVRSLALGFGLSDAGSLADYVARAAVVPLGAVLGGTWLGLYLFLSLNLFRVHENDAFAALRIAGYNNFLRCRLTPEELTIHALGVPSIAPENAKHPVAVECIEEITVRP